MKILIIDNAAISYKNKKYYVHKTTGEFGKELRNLGHDVEYFQFCNRKPSNISFFDLKDNGISITTVERRRYRFFSYLNAYIRALRRIVNNDVLYIYYPNSLSLIACFAIVLRKRYGIYVRGEKGIFNRRSFWLYRHAFVIFTVAKGFSDKINIRLGQKKARTIKPMISFSIDDIVTGRSYNKSDDFRILYLGRIDRDKGLIELLQSMKILRERNNKKFRLDIVGDGAFLGSLKEKIKELNLHDDIRCWGAVTDVEVIKQWYLKSDIYILPSYHEGFPRTLYEAMMFGTPIVTTFVGAIPGIMRNDFNCFQIREKSVDSIVDKLMELLDNYHITETVVNNATQTVFSVLEQYKFSHAEHLHHIISGHENVVPASAI